MEFRKWLMILIGVVGIILIGEGIEDFIVRWLNLEWLWNLSAGIKIFIGTLLVIVAIWRGIKIKALMKYA